MSKRWSLPTQKGVELFPSVTVAPTKLVIEGVATGTPLYASIAERFNGRLKQFHGHCQQDYSLTENAVMKRRISFGDEAVATYTNMHGQETLMLRISSRVMQEAINPPFTPWDWALVNFKVPDVTAAEFSAFMRVPVLEAPKGVSVDYGDNGSGFRPTSFPDITNTDFQELAPITIEGSFTGASLLTDLTIVDPRAAVIIDIYGQLPGSAATLCAAQHNPLPVTYSIALPSTEPTPGDWQTTGLIDDYPWYVDGYFWLRLPDCTLQRITVYLGSVPNNDVVGTFSAQLSMTETIAVAGTSGVDITFTAVRTGANLQITVTASEDVGISVYGQWDPDWTLFPNNFWWVLSVSGQTNTPINWDPNTSTYHAIGSTVISYSDESGSPVDEQEPGIAVTGYANDGYSTAFVPGHDSIPSGQDAQTNYNYYFVPYLFATPAPTDDDAPEETALVTVAGVVGRGSAEWLFSEHTSDISSYHVWEGRNIYPDPIPTAVLAENITISNKPGAQVDPLYGMTKLGTIVADRRRGALTFRKA